MKTSFFAAAMRAARAVADAMFTHPLLVLAALTLAQVLLRLTLSPALEMDEAEQIVWSQRLAAGYGVQPPLYTWLQWGVNHLFGGQSLLALSVLKHSLLAAAYVLLWHSAKMQGLGTRCRWLAAASLLLLPTVCWMAVRDLTHSVLLLPCTAWLYWALLRLLARPTPARFVALGAALAAGMLAKYNFALIAAPLLGAALLDPAQRRALFSRGWPLMPLTAALLLAPHLLWLAGHWGEIATRMGDKLARGGISAWPRLTALGQLFTDAPMALALWASVTFGCLGTGWLRRPPAAPASGAAQLLRRYLLLALLTLLALVLFATPSRLTPRWLEPLAALLPMAVFLRRPELERHPRCRRLAACIALVAVLGMFLATMRPVWHMFSHRPDDINLDTAALAAAARDAGFDTRSPIVAPVRQVLAGNLRLAYPDAPVLQCPRAGCTPLLEELERQGSGWLLVLELEVEHSKLPAAQRAQLHEVYLPFRRPLLGGWLPASRDALRHTIWMHWQPPAAAANTP